MGLWATLSWFSFHVPTIMATKFYLWLSRHFEMSIFPSVINLWVRRGRERERERAVNIFSFFLSIIGKPTEVKTWYLDPEKEGELIRRIQQQSCRAFLELDLQDFGLFDFRIDNNGNPFLLECNLFWSFTSLCPLSAVAKGSGFTIESLFDLMVQNALFRKEKE